MIEYLLVENWRSFLRLEMCGLGRVNLLVGENNSGKTSLLEAVQIVASGADPQALLSMATRRGEVLDSETSYRGTPEIDISSWFHGFDFDVNSLFRIKVENSAAVQACEFKIIESPEELQRFLFEAKSSLPNGAGNGRSADNTINPEELLISTPQALRISGFAKPHGDFFSEYPLTARAGLFLDRLRVRSAGPEITRQDVQFVPTAGLSMAALVEMVDDLALTDDEDLALTAMKLLDDRIERFASKGRERRPRIMVRLKGTKKPLPIGSLGDGVNRLLTIAIAMAKSANGILLIDEIDAGLHFTAMDRMWRFVRAAAERLNVQVFATTHSRDCYESLAVICTEQLDSPSHVSIQRVENGNEQTVGYSEPEILAAARRGLEVR